MVDLNGDGYDDVLVPGSDKMPVAWYAGSPTGLFGVPTATVTPGAY